MIGANMDWSLVHGFFAIMGGFMVMVDGVPVYPAVPGWGNMAITDFDFPDIPEEEIRDKSKGDGLSKGLVLLQLIWFATRVIARAAHRLPISELEIATCAYVVVTSITYAVWWQKPLNAERYVPVTLREHAMGKDLAYSYQEKRRTARSVLITLITGQLSSGDITRMNRVPTMFIGAHEDEFQDNHYFLVQCAAGVIFGGLHVACWNFQFPTHLEMVLWRTGAVLITLVSLSAPGSVIIVPMLPEILDNGGWWRRAFGNAVYWVYAIGMPLIYVLSRLVLMGIQFSTLRDLPKGAFEEVVWASFIPHIE
jgi:hypothetical protein